MTKHTLDFSTDMVSIYTASGDNVLKLTNFFYEGQSNLLKLGYLPPVVRSISPPLKIYPDAPEDRGYIIVVERKPMIVNFMAHKLKHITLKHFLLSIPWQHYFIVINKHENEYRLSDVGLYFSTTPLASLDHVFYTPYLPSISTPRSGDALSIGSSNHDLANVSSFDTYEPIMEPHKFSSLFAQIYSTIWTGWVFNDQPMEPLHDFIKAYNFHPQLEFEENPYTQAMTSLGQIASIPFDQILDERVFDALQPVFDFGEYLKYLNTVTDESSFDFKAAFEKAFANGVVLPPKPIYKPGSWSLKKKPISLSFNKYSDIYNAPIGSYTITQEQLYTSYNSSTATTINLPPSAYVAMAQDSADWINAVNVMASQIVCSLYQDGKKRWRRMNGTFASKQEIAIAKNPWMEIPV